MDSVCAVCPQLHFIESYLRESDGGFADLSKDAREKVMEEVYVEVNR